VRAAIIIATLLTACGGNQTPSAPQWASESRAHTFEFSEPNTESVSFDELVHVKGEPSVWAIELALTVEPAEAMAAGDTVQAIFRIESALDTSRIATARVLDEKTLENVPPLTTSAIVDGIPAAELVVSVDLTYTATAARSSSVRVEVAAIER